MLQPKEEMAQVENVWVVLEILKICLLNDTSIMECPLIIIMRYCMMLISLKSSPINLLLVDQSWLKSVLTKIS